MPPKADPVPPYLNFAPLDNALATLRQSAERYESALEKVGANGGASLSAVNATLMESERALASGPGLPGRTWFMNALYAPGFYTGYGVKTIPAVREAIEQKQWQEADAAILQVAKILGDQARLINQAAEKLQ